MTRWIFFAFIVNAALFFMNSGIPVVHAEAGKSGVSNAPTLLIDVRTPQEFAAGHLTGAINIEYQEIVEKIASVAADKKTRIEVYCRSGRRSEIAQTLLRNAGYDQVVNLGGFEDLRKTRPVTLPKHSM